MKNKSAQLVGPALVLAVGIGSLANSLQWFPAVNWVWSLGLAVAGIAILLQGLTPATIVFGPLLLIASVLSILRQTGTIGWRIELPLFIIALGALLLIERLIDLPQDPQRVARGSEKPSD